MTLESSKKSLESLCLKYGIDDKSRFKKALEANSSLDRLIRIAKEDKLVVDFLYLLEATKLTVKKIELELT